MNRICRKMTIIVLVLTILITPAFASTYDKNAQELKTMGMFKGTESGFDLDRAPTRTEAAVMLVRLLGSETAAQTQYSSGNISHPFSDVATWASPYVAWLYQNKLANGVSSKLFGADEKCSAEMYCTFVLRSLGYSDASGGDFTYAEVLAFAEDVGIYSSDLSSGTFFRDQAVAISYQALATKLKGGNTTLLSKLISSGAISQASAQTSLDKIAAYNAYIDASSAWANAQAIDATVTAAMKLVSQQYPEINSDITMKAAVKVVVDGSGLKMEMITDTSVSGVSQDISIWVKDGWVYMTDGTEKVKTALDSEMLSTLVAQANSSVEVPSFPIYMLDSISSSKTSAGTLYTMALSRNYSDFDLAEMGIDDSSLTAFSLNLGALQVLVKNDGSLSSIKMSCTMNMTVNNEGTLVPISLNYELTENINAIGSSVSIAYPDFSGYVEG